MDDTYFDFKHNIESNEKLVQNRIDFLEIYVKKALEEYVKIDSRFEQLQTQYNTFINETSDFFDWYLSQNAFKKIWWNIRKLNYKQLKQIKDNNGNWTTTGEKRTGCFACAFGVHLESSPNKFQRDKINHPKLWETEMKPIDEGGLGMKEVLDFIGVPIE